jgi:phosphatidylglycerol:prolipoprotein diacylglycerol transferase
MVLDLSVDPVLFRWGAFALTWKSVCTSLALLLGTLWALHLSERVGIASDAASQVACWTLLGGLLGARGVHVLTHVAYYAANPSEILILADGSGSLAGALLGGTLTLVAVSKWLRVPAFSLFNAAVPALLLGTILHALGNFLTGAGWGAPTASTWGVIYWHPGAMLPPDLLSVPLHPYPLYRIALAAMLFVLASRWHARLDSSPGLFMLGSYTLVSAGLMSFAGATPLFERVVLVLLGLGAFSGLVYKNRTMMIPNYASVQSSEQEAR